MITRRSLFGFLTLLFAPSAIPSPERKEAGVRLMEVPVAGYRVHDGPRVESSLTAGAKLRLQREAANVRDVRAVAILTDAGARIGYVPFHLNAIPARLLDGGIPLGARVVSLEPQLPPWRRLRVEITIEREARR